LERYETEKRKLNLSMFFNMILWRRCRGGGA